MNKRDWQEIRYFTLLGALCLFFIVFGGEEANAAGGMKCERAWANAGDSSYTLIKKCGQPQGRGHVTRDYGKTMEVLYYELGGTTFTVHLTNNVITHIQMSRF